MFHQIIEERPGFIHAITHRKDGSKIEWVWYPKEDQQVRFFWHCQNLEPVV